MIYNSNIKLTGNEADRFLESCDVTIYEECIAIDEYEYSYDEAQSILSENGISLYDDCIVLEGEQAEEYKKRKAQEKKDANKKELDRANRRYAGVGSFSNGRYKNQPTGYRNTDRNPNYSKNNSEKEENRYNRAERLVNSDEYNKNGYGRNPVNKNNYKQGHRSIKPHGYTGPSHDFTVDAAHRHMRRHPKQYGESASIFSDTNII